MREAVVLAFGFEKKKICEYQYEKDKSMHPAYHFLIPARELAPFGLPYQKDGVWE
jgi:hypothetical protein